VSFKYPIIIFLFLLFALLQMSFLPSIALFNEIPNLIFILFFILMFFGEKEALLMAVIAGFSLDLLYFSHFGLSILTLVIIFLLQKASDHFFEKGSQENLIFYFIPSFLVQYGAYTGLWYLFSRIFDFEFAVGISFIMGLGYNLLFALAGFYLYQKVVPSANEKQLKLFS